MKRKRREEKKKTILQLGNRCGVMNILIHVLDLLSKVLGNLRTTDLEGRRHHSIVDRERIRGQEDTLDKLKSTERTRLSGLLELLGHRKDNLGILAQLADTLSIRH